MAQILHYQRLVGCKGEIDPKTIDWGERHKDHEFVWRASPQEDGLDEVANKLREVKDTGGTAMLELLAVEGTDYRVMQENLVSVLSVEEDAGGLSARLKWMVENP